MLDYYTLQKTLETLSNDEHKYIAKDIATLCRQGKLTPYFSYNRYTAEKIPMTDRTGKDCEDFEPGTIRLFNDGYLTNHQLLDLLDGYSDSVVIGYAHDERGYECELFFNAINSDRYFNDENYSPYSDNDVLTVTKEHLSFKREQVQSYIASRQTNEQNTPEQQEIAKLKKEIANLQKQLEERNDTPAGITPLKGLYKHNADKALFITTGQELAKYIWSMDTEQAIRTGDMVQQLKQVMNSIDNNLLPDDKAIREWLSGIAPDYAKKSGKPPKDAPREISLIMRK